MKGKKRPFKERKWKYLKMNRTKFIYLKYHWRLIIHLLFRTYRFGVNNKTWKQNEFAHGFFGLPWYKLEKWNVVHNYRQMKIRCGPGICFIPYRTYQKLFEE